MLLYADAARDGFQIATIDPSIQSEASAEMATCCDTR
jgi:hypothetical protein